jgi:hypothetical protein
MSVSFKLRIIIDQGERCCMYTYRKRAGGRVGYIECAKYQSIAVAVGRGMEGH